MPMQNFLMDAILVNPFCGASKPEMQIVKCKDCGFLSLRTKDTREFTYCNDQSRREERFTPSAVLETIACAMDRFDSVDGPGILRLTVINRERECSAFMQWLPAFSPKEHVEIQRANEMIRIAEERKQADEEVAVISVNLAFSPFLGSGKHW